MKKPLLITSGEPAGIGLDICLALATLPYPVVILADKIALMARMQQLGMHVVLRDYSPTVTIQPNDGSLTIWSLPTAVPVTAGILEPRNAEYVITMLTVAIDACLAGEFAALVTAPVQKSVLNQAGFVFSGHTEFLAARCGVPRVVMCLAAAELKVALATTHLPLRAVPDAITQSGLVDTLGIIHRALQRDFGVLTPKIAVTGLNPHAGEAGYLGREEIEIITPAIASAREAGIAVFGPFAADTLFTQAAMDYDMILAMYHDQGLPVLKYASFGTAVNITLGLPIIRTSVDHGTALALAGTGQAQASSLIAAVTLAAELAWR
jgi:4-hydroxythreonine-4-phosphate dehydrogenase